ncbi:MAG: ATPase, T2SS/T4P/T4SS family, partial [Byssovorax sp.]
MVAPGQQTSSQIPIQGIVGDPRGSVPDGGPMAFRGPATIGPQPYPSVPAVKGSPPPSVEVPSSQPSSGPLAERFGRAPAPRIEPKPGDAFNRQDVISHFPLEHDPDDSGMIVPGPPRVPLSTGPQTPNAPFAAASPRPISRAPQPRPLSVPTSSSPLTPDRNLLPGGVPIERSTSPSMAYGPPGSASPTAVPSGLPSSLPGRAPLHTAVSDPPDAAASSRAAAHRGALLALIERVSELVDLRALDGGTSPDDAMTARVDRALAERTAVLRAEGAIPGDVDVDALVAEARRELLDLGPLAPLFNDEDVSEIQIVRSDYVVAMHGRRQVPSDIGFSSEAAVARVIRRLCVSAGKPLQPGEQFIERRLPRGARMFAVLPPASEQGHVVVIRKPQRVDLTLEDLVRSGTISRAMAGLFAQCVEARANLLVTGAVGAGATSLLSALAAAGSTNDRVVVLQEDDELIFNQPHTISILLG